MEYKVFSNGRFEHISEDKWTEYCKRFQHINAAGGLVVNKNGELLLIFRRGFWDLPKGKQDVGENLEHTALREVQEECGIYNLTIIDKLLVTYHTYQLFGYPILKTTQWYQMTYYENQPLTPQTTEGIEKVLWVKPNELSRFLNKSYATVHEVIEQYFKRKIQ